MKGQGTGGTARLAGAPSASTKVSRPLPRYLTTEEVKTRSDARPNLALALNFDLRETRGFLERARPGKDENQHHHTYCDYN